MKTKHCHCGPRQELQPSKVHGSKSESGPDLPVEKHTRMAMSCHLGLGEIASNLLGFPGEKSKSHLGSHTQSTTDESKWTPSGAMRCHHGDAVHMGTTIEADASMDLRRLHTLPIKLKGGLIQLL